MDGAIILAADASRIARANVHLVPKASIPTSETGTRHRTAERVARSIDVPVITVSEAMATIAVFRNDAQAHPPADQPGWSTGPAQAISTLQRFKARFDLAAGHPVDPRGGGHRLGARRGGRAPARRDGACASPRRSRATWSSWARTAG